MEISYHRNRINARRLYFSFSCLYRASVTVNLAPEWLRAKCSGIENISLVPYACTFWRVVITLSGLPLTVHRLPFTHFFLLFVAIFYDCLSQGTSNGCLKFRPLQLFSLPRMIQGTQLHQHRGHPNPPE